MVDDISQVVIVGREDYVVRSLQVKSGTESWNATFSRMMQLPAFPSSSPGGGGVEGASLPSSTLGAPQVPPPQSSLQPEVKLPVRLSVTSDNTLRAYQLGSGYRQWSIKFDSPPVAAYHGHGRGRGAGERGRGP